MPKKIVQSYYSSSSNQWETDWVWEFYYNPDNTIRKVLSFSTSGYHYVCEYTYNNDGYLEQSVTTFIDDYEEGIEDFGSITYTYENGLMTRSVWTDDENAFEEHFYTNGILSQSQSSFSDYYYTYQFDDNNNLIGLIYSGSSEHGYSPYTCTYTYDNKKSPFINLSAKMKSALYAVGGAWIFPVTLTYNHEAYPNNNNVVAEHVHSSVDNLIDTYTHTYTYDSEGFPTEKIIGVPNRRFTYEYY